MLVVWLHAVRSPSTSHCSTDLPPIPSLSSAPGPACSRADLHSGGHAVEGVQEGAQEEAVLSLQRHTSELSHPPSVAMAGRHGSSALGACLCLCLTSSAAHVPRQPQTVGSTAPAITLCTLPPHSTKWVFVFNSLVPFGHLLTPLPPPLPPPLLIFLPSPLPSPSFPAPATHPSSLPSAGIWLNSGWSLQQPAHLAPLPNGGEWRPFIPASGQYTV